MSGVAGSRSRTARMVPRWAAVILALFAWLIAIPLAHGVAPWAISKLTPRYGWANGFPGEWNRLGLVLVIAAAGLLFWILGVALAEMPDRVRLGLSPSWLIVHGPYRFTRNPMYVAEMALWLGWTLFFGSAGVFAGCLILFAILNFAVLPREERGLETALGQTYREYKDSVPRWLGKAKKQGQAGF